MVNYYNTVYPVIVVETERTATTTATATIIITMTTTITTYVLRGLLRSMINRVSTLFLSTRTPRRRTRSNGRRQWRRRSSSIEKKNGR